MRAMQSSAKRDSMQPCMRAMQCYAIQVLCNADKAMQCNAMQCNAMQCNNMHCNAIYNAMQSMQCNAIQLQVPRTRECKALSCFYYNKLSCLSIR